MTPSRELSAEPGRPLTQERRPLRADAERNRRKLLASAEVVFAERGLDATLDDIAAHAGVGVGTAYRRFANKEEVVQALFQLKLANTVALAERCEDMPDPWEGLVHFLRETCSAMAADRGYRHVLMRGASAQGAAAGFKERLFPVTERLVERARAAGLLRDDFRPEDLPMVILMMEAVTDVTDRLDTQVWERYLTLLLSGMRTAAAPPLPLPSRPPAEPEIDEAFARRHHRFG